MTIPGPSRAGPLLVTEATAPWLRSTILRIRLICAGVSAPLHFGGVSNDRKRAAERPSRPVDFELSMDDLRKVAAFTSAAAEVVLPHFEARCPDDGRPRQALESAQAFVHGDPRSNVQRTSAPAAHRAGREAASAVAFHAAMAAGDAAASAYLHPLADTTQVKHILRAPAHAIRVFELADGPDEASAAILQRFATFATPRLIDVLLRYPRMGFRPNPTGPGANRINCLVQELDELLRNQSTPEAEQS